MILKLLLVACYGIAIQLYAKTRHLYAKLGCYTEQLPSNCYYYWFLKNTNSSRKWNKGELGIRAAQKNHWLMLMLTLTEIDRSKRCCILLSLFLFSNEDAIRIFWVWVFINWNWPFGFGFCLIYLQQKCRHIRQHIELWLYRFYVKQFALLLSSFSFSLWVIYYMYILAVDWFATAISDVYLFIIQIYSGTF